MKPLSDAQAHELLKAARTALGSEPAATDKANHALETARLMLTRLAVSLLDKPGSSPH